ncbi:MAG: acetate kinase [Clostridiales bacterium]|nr:acetate kinase [Clostridiales bacterium]
MIVLVINTNRTFLKYQLIKVGTGDVLAKGLCDHIGGTGSTLTHSRRGADSVTSQVDLPDIATAVQSVIKVLTSAKQGVIKNKSAIEAVGHRIVHGGEKFTAPAIITPEIKRAIEAYDHLAPLHNPPSMEGILACEKALPGIPQVAVFDTAFHHTMPEKAAIYALPYEFYEKYDIRKYGFHGTSHAYVSQRAADLLGQPLDTLKLITCHLGFGSSIAAVDRGRSVDTTMGLTPLAGLAMCSRSGDIDPAIVTFLMEKENLDIDGMENMLNNQSGLFGISGVSPDLRDIYAAAGQGNSRAALAIDLFKYQCRKLIGAYTSTMGGVDAVVFTAGIGENAPDIRAGACKDLGFMGITIDPYRNAAAIGKEAIISDDDSPVKVLVVPTQEELVIANETARVCGHGR